MKGTLVILVLAMSTASYCFPAVGVPPVKHEHPEVPPEAICKSMSVGHGHPAQNSPSPYTIELTETKVVPGGTIEVVISSPGEKEPFRGLIVQGRCNDEPVGSFTGSSISEGSKFHDCGDGVQNSYVFITESGDQKKSVLTWQAPQEPLDCPIEFYVSTVKTFSTYWIKQKADKTLTVAA